MEMQWQKSETIGELIKSLTKAQIKFDKVLKESENPAFRSKYADLATVIDATRTHLASEGISIIQMPHARFGAEDTKEMILTTLMAHTSGEWISTDLSLPAMMRERFDAQAVGSAITYARRYALAAMTGVAQEDDDGNKATGQGTKEAAQAVASEKIKKAKSKATSPIVFTEWGADLMALSGDGLEILKKEVEPEELRKFGFKRDGNVVTIPRANAHQLDSLCLRINLPVHWAESSKTA